MENEVEVVVVEEAVVELSLEMLDMCAGASMGVALF
jgi:hypothetical protein